MQTPINNEQVVVSKSHSKSWTSLYSGKRILQISVLLWIFVHLYTPAFGMLYWTWLKRGDMSHGFLIPLISLYLIWLRRETLGHIRLRPACLWGIPVMFAAGVMLLVGVLGSLITLQEFSIIVMIAGLVLCLFGKDYLWALKLPIAYLIFMIPIQDELGGPLYWPLQLLAANVTGAVLEVCGIPVLVERQLIFLPNSTLEVIPGCSGVSSMIAILALGIPLAFISQKRVWCRVVLLISALIAALVANWMRVVTMGFWAYYYGDVLQEPFHTIQGLVFAQLGFVFLFVGAWILAKVPAAPSSAHSPGKVSETLLEKGNEENQSRRWNQSWFATLLILLGLAGYLSFHVINPVPPKKDFTTFPLSIGPWRGKEGVPLREAFTIQRADHELVRTYTSPSNREFHLYVAYIERQSQWTEIVNYRSARLHENSNIMEIPNAQKESISVNHSILRDSQNKEHIFFWYDINGRIINNSYWAKLATIWDNIMYGHSNGAFVSVSSALTKEDNREERIRETLAFIRSLIPVLRQYIP